MSSIRLLFLWHMHQPYYKDLVSGEYRLPWVRLHALKDYYGMVKLLDEFPGVHQTFNLVPSLIAQINDYVAGAARDPFLQIVSRRADEFDYSERFFAVQYLFQSNLENMISRYPRYRQLWEEFRQFRRRAEDAAHAAREMSSSDITDLQVLSQIAWMDEFFLDDPDIRDLIAKQRDYSFDDQQLVLKKEREFLGKVLPAYGGAAQRGTIEISTSPYYHPILPLVCDTDIGAVSHPGVPLPRRFRHPEDARAQIERGLDLHEKVFGVRPRGMWPSEGSVSDEALTIAHDAGLQWVATDEGVLGRSLNTIFNRDDRGNLDPASAEMLYQIFRWEQGSAQMHVIFRDHSLSDLIGFVYSGIAAQDAAADFIRRIKHSAAPLLAKGIDAVVPVILDGENAWETYPQSGREFLRRLYQGIEKDDSFEALTVSEAIERQSAPKQLTSIFPGSWISANFDVWIGAPEDNQSWDHLSAARDFFSKHSAQVSDESRELAYEELLIAEGSDWNWWYGPEHHSANDQDFDELYRKHLSNVYHALGAAPPEALAQPISGGVTKITYTPQTAYIHPQIDGRDIGYFDWLGAATYVADRRSSAMHGKLFLLDTGYAGVDEENLYCRLDFMESPDEWSRESARLLVTIEPLREGLAADTYCLETEILAGQIQNWNFSRDRQPIPEQNELGIGVSLESIFECQLPLALLRASSGTLLRVRFSLWRGQLPLDSLPQEGSIELRVVPEDELISVPYAKP